MKTTIADPTVDRPKIEGKFYPLQYDEWLQACRELKPSERDVLYPIRCLDPYEDGLKINCADIAKALSSQRQTVHRQTVSRAIKKLEELGFIKSGLYLKYYNRSDREEQIRNRLRAELGGLAEVSTPSGKIDLLTDTEIIEIKRINDWKAALGQILVYSAFYPEHQKRIHLFGSQAELEKLHDIEAACLEFNIKVTIEVVTAIGVEK